MRSYEGILRDFSHNIEILSRAPSMIGHPAAFWTLLVTEVHLQGHCLKVVCGVIWTMEMKVFSELPNKK